MAFCWSELLNSKTQKGWQELKEHLAYLISSSCSSSLKNLHQLHARSISFGLHRNLFLCALLITKYCSFGHLKTAQCIFHDGRNANPSKTLLWNSLIRGYWSNKRPSSVLQIYRQMTQSILGCVPDKHTFNLVIAACTHLSEFELGCRVHAHASRIELESDVLVGTALVNMYCKAGHLETARKVFERIPWRDVVSWNALIEGYSQDGSIHEVSGLFRNMRLANGIHPTEATMVSLISICGYLSFLKDGYAVHSHIIVIGFEADQFICNSLIEMYIKCNCLNYASELFHHMTPKDSVSWSTMIGGYLQNGYANDALKLFDQMILKTQILPTRPILLNVLLACAELGDWQRGKWIDEEYIINCDNELKLDARLNTARIYMYAKCGRMETSLMLLENIAQNKDVVAWNAMVKACAELGQVDRASKLFLEMQKRGINPDHITFLTMLSLVSSTSLLGKGMEAHTCIIKRGFGLERQVANSLIDMYAKCGSIKDSYEVFNEIPKKDVVSWSSMIKGYAWNGNGKKAIDLFQLLKETETKPNHITFVAVLSACSHSGFVEKGRELFTCMKKDYGLEPAMEHYACIVDLFCRAGLLTEAYEFIDNTVLEACTTAGLWGSLLSACRIQGNWGIGEVAARHLFDLEPGNAANYMMLADIYTSAGQREAANGVLRLLKEKGLTKNPGCSWVVG